VLQSYAPQLPAAYEERGQELGLQHYLGILKRRIFHLLVPFIVVAIVGSLVVAIQRPIYQAEGKILVESQEIPSDLVRPTVTTAANERIQVIQQRIMTRDNLLGIVNKFGLFTAEQRWMSGTQILDLMRDRTQIKLVDVQGQQVQRSPTIAFTLSYDDESPDRATKVANEFLTLILNEDARNRTSRATETSKFLEREVKRLQGEVDAVDLQISEIKRRPHKVDVVSDTPEQVKAQQASLTALKNELIQKSATYSEAHPVVIALKKKIAAMEKAVPPTSEPSPAPKAEVSSDDGLKELDRQRQSVEKHLDEATTKLAAARLGETLERDQQSERLQVIEQPTVPQKPVRPNRPKLFGIVFALAAMCGAGVLFTAETLDRSIKSSQELVGLVDSHLIVSIPFMSTPAEVRRRRRKMVLALLLLVLTLTVGVAGAVYLGVSIDFSWFDTSWLDVLTRLSK
jgi:uncharacterized protein involved in exopolysaccharide biosynthesis